MQKNAIKIQIFLSEYLAVVEPYVILGKLDLRIPRHLGLKHII